MPLPWDTVFRREIAWVDLDAAQRDAIARATGDLPRGTLLFSEPLPTFTAGRRAREQDLLWGVTETVSRGVRIEKVERGGQWTYHGPGQLVLFPIAPIERLGYARVEARRFADEFRAIVQRWLTTLGVVTEVRDCPYGLYAEKRKLVSFGLRIARGISTHGAALYLKDQRTAFAGIAACGAPDLAPISLAELGCEIEWATAAEVLARAVKKGFQGLKN